MKSGERSGEILGDQGSKGHLLVIHVTYIYIYIYKYTYIYREREREREREISYIMDPYGPV